MGGKIHALKAVKHCGFNNFAIVGCENGFYNLNTSMRDYKENKHVSPNDKKQEGCSIQRKNTILSR